MTTKDIMNVGISAQALALLGENVKLSKKKKVSLKDITKTATTNIVGVPLLRVQSQLISTL